MLSDPLFLSRLQFAWVIAWHILLPAFTVGLASYIAVLEGIYFATGRDVYFRSSMFWIKIFSVSFGMGVVSGIIMPFQFGTNWSRFSDVTANVLAPLFAYEAIMAFFLEFGVSRSAFIRTKARATMGAFFCGPDGCVRNASLVILDPFRQQLDADTSRL